MPREQKRDALQLIFSFFLGLLLVVFVGVGVYTFYPGPNAPDDPRQERLQELYREQERVYGRSDRGELTAEEQDEIDEINDEIDLLNEDIEDEFSVWGRNTSIVLIVFATLLMSVSLFLPEHMLVISNGVLLGGLFTVVYGTGWSFVGRESIARFAVVSVALLLTIVFGYVKFVRPRQQPAETAEPASPAPPED